ncbi:type VII toxin-antitoxin system HepT family RNase toxin [Marinomonas ostreistagni]|uniref:DUF86 domain-containing protein n=1 Tax=Marinomonas ostreistagni TaxID=359209 RepID=A0ABS0ZBW1_9GAMM|nr:HepT-like ribonuclease domain-containing protein [Marinomonas ostreistagni]MBJ7551158.1 DUF86 domain-containing protein [Marinomonas ostreistagni]
MNEIIDHKIAIIHHSLARIREVYNLAQDRLDTDLTSQDSIIFNLQRACQASVDIANYFNKTLFSQFPKDNHDSFEALHKSGFISAELALRLLELIEFSCSAVRDEQTLNLEIVKHVVENRLSDFEDYITSIKELEA